MFKYNLAALGGTFDHFHQGHKTLISHAFTIADHIVVGITADSFVVEKINSKLIEPFTIRRRSVLEYACSIGKTENISVIQLTDMFGPTLIDKDIDCIVVSPLTHPGAILINEERIRHNLPLLPIEVCHLELSADGKAISSTRIRSGEINRDGFVYTSILNRDIELNSNQKQAVKKPFGKVYSDIGILKLKLINNEFVVSVGDAATRMCLQQNIQIAFGIYDNLEKRQPINFAIDGIVGLQKMNAINPPGTITRDLVKKIQKAIVESIFVEVDGEEDLAVIPLTLLLPLGSIVLYGQPNKGIVYVEITEEKKEWVKKLILN